MPGLSTRYASLRDFAVSPPSPDTAAFFASPLAVWVVFDIDFGWVTESGLFVAFAGFDVVAALVALAAPDAVATFWLLRVFGPVAVEDRV